MSTPLPKYGSNTDGVFEIGRAYKMDDHKGYTNGQG